MPSSESSASLIGCWTGDGGWLPWGMRKKLKLIATGSAALIWLIGLAGVPNVVAVLAAIGALALALVACSSRSPGTSGLSIPRKRPGNP